MVPHLSSLVRSLCFCITLIIAPSAALTEMRAADLVLEQQGALPILLTVPHGGREAIPGIPPRDIAGKPGGGRGFVATRDADTDALAQQIAAEIKTLTGKDCYLVLAKFDRKYIDANRPPEIAVDSPGARPFYDYYHAAIRRFIDEIRSKYPAGLLLDIHGQSQDPTVLMRGTQNGHAVMRLLARSGFAAVTGPKGLFGQLEANGFRVFPSNGMPPSGTAENAGLDGGYTLTLYGSQSAAGIDAVQLEFGHDYRERPILSRTAKDTARAIAAFYDIYLR